MRPTGCNRVFNLRCAASDAEAWEEALETSIQNSIGRKRNLDIMWFEKSLEKSFKFWAFLRISEKQFFEQAESGDIILCSSKASFKHSHRVSRVFLLLRLDERQYEDGEVTTFRDQKHHVLRIDSEKSQVVLEPWA